VIDSGTRERMREILREIQTGAFAREFILENQAAASSSPRCAAAAEHPMERSARSCAS